MLAEMLGWIGWLWIIMTGHADKGRSIFDVTFSAVAPASTVGQGVSAFPVV